VGSFGPAATLVPSCGPGLGGAAIASDGTTRGFAECNGNPDGPIWYFRHRPGAAPARQLTPYTGAVLAVAWDGVGATYVVFQQGSQLKIAKRTEAGGAYSPITTLTTTGANARLFTADVVASNGQWWAVWSEQVGPGGEFAQTELFQRHTLLGVQPRTRITATASNIDDDQPALAYLNGKVTLAWTRAVDPAVPGPSDIRIATSTGGAWSSRLFASLGTANYDPDVFVAGVVTFVTWGRDGRVVVADNGTGSFVSRTFGTPGFIPSVAYSFGKVFVAWVSDPGNQVVVAERSGGVWTSAAVVGAPSAPTVVLAQGGKARVVYRTTSQVAIRTQI